MKGVHAEYFLGTVSAVPDTSSSFVIKANIPEVIDNVTCYPLRSNIDEPKIGDLVLIRDLDPEYHSYFVYEKVNENDFTGIRCKGKMIDITDESLKIGIFDEGDFKDNERPANTSWIELKEDGDLDIILEDDLFIQTAGSIKAVTEEDFLVTTEQNASIEIGGHTKINIKNGEEVAINGKVNVTINGDYSLKVTGNLDIDASKITIGGNTLTLKTPSASAGPFNWVCNCPYTGIKHGMNTILLKR